MMRRVFVLSIVLLTATVAISQSAVRNPSTAIGCRQATTTLPQKGVAYRGAVTNDDYHFSARIPSDLTGWGGIADNAPFHGFTMFLDAKGDSCIVFEIHLRVDRIDTPKRLSGGTAVQLGKAVGWQELKDGTAKLLSSRRLSFSETLCSFDTGMMSGELLHEHADFCSDLSPIQLQLIFVEDQSELRKLASAA